MSLALESSRAEARCAGHPDAVAERVCPRCGAFVCAACERRTRPEAVPMCPACWDLRQRTVQENTRPSNTRLQTVGLVLGCISLLPLWPVMIASVVVNIIGIARAKEPPARQVRWRPIAGLCLSVFSIVAWGVAVALVAAASDG